MTTDAGAARNELAGHGASGRDNRDPGFGIYIHWPFCAAKCPYCDFNSHVRHHPVDQARFGRALARELAWMANRAGAQGPVTSIFFGGGTPSLMAAETVGGVIETIAALWSVAPDCEITLEANPTSVEAERFAGYRAAGVNRVSLGVQALNDADLKVLGRLHTAEEARRALDTAAGTFSRVSCDLIYARPGQTCESWADELQSAIALGVHHLSLYQLTIEPGTPFHALHAAGRLVVPDPDLAADLYDQTRGACAEAGLIDYEVSNYARPGDESRHNLVYWRYGPYVGVGPGAHGRLPVGRGLVATETLKHPECWCEAVEQAGHGVADEVVLDASAMADEMLIMGLRLREGIDLGRMEALCGLRVRTSVLETLGGDGLIVVEGPRLKVTAAGRLVTNRLALALSGALEASPDGLGPMARRDAHDASGTEARRGRIGAATVAD